MDIYSVDFQEDELVNSIAALTEAASTYPAGGYTDQKYRALATKLRAAKAQGPIKELSNGDTVWALRALELAARDAESKGNPALAETFMAVFAKLDRRSNARPSIFEVPQAD